jgi:predicted acylesterase/phospholipase RssA
MSDRRKCDIVMQGGVTSGVVYPGLIFKLAEYYDFQSIGGTSAGAIAAVLTAAAEYSRRNGKANAFAEVADVPTWLGGDSKFGSGSNLFSLFQPQPATAGLFRFATAFLVTSWPKRIRAWLTLLWLEILVGITPGVILGYLSGCGAYLSGDGWRLGLVLFLSALVCIAGVVVTVLAGIVIRLSRLSDNHFGLCTGNAEPDEKKPPALVPWLNDQINEIAGKPSSHPLTFGDLQRAGINLRMMTTCLTWGRPFTLPFDSSAFYFSPQEFRSFFPEEVVKWMETNPPKDAEAPHEKVDTTGLLPLPDCENLPVIVAARFSLSFPFLFCAVPLYAVDWTLRRREEGEPAPVKPVPGGSIGSHAYRKPEHVWFTDGGICNNFPLHLFDGPVPRWPTFGINLTDLRPDLATPSRRTWMPQSNRGGIQPIWTRLSEKAGLSETGGLVVAIINSARNWVNSLQSVVPGYRDRIVHISLDDKEGGLNLSMPPDILASLNTYGCEAGQQLIDHFIHGTDDGKPTPMTWQNQRWIRYRSTMALLETFLAKFAYSTNNPEPGDVPYTALIDPGPHTHPSHGYQLTATKIPQAVSETNQLIALGNQMAAGELQEGSPHPQPALVIRPNF